LHNVKAQTTAFATFSPYKDWWSIHASRIALALAPVNTRRAREREFLHTAHFSAISGRQLRRAGLRGDNLKPGALLFISAYNGDAEVYFRGFSEKLAGVMNQVWKWCVDWQPFEKYEHLDSFIKKYERASTSFYCVYPDTSKRVRSSLVLRRQVDKLCAAALVDDDAAFSAAFERVSLLHWGDIEVTEADL
jgi:hypothetical protein